MCCLRIRCVCLSLECWGANCYGCNTTHTRGARLPSAEVILVLLAEQMQQVYTYDANKAGNTSLVPKNDKCAQGNGDSESSCQTFSRTKHNQERKRNTRKPVECGSRPHATGATSSTRTSLPHRTTTLPQVGALTKPCSRSMTAEHWTDVSRCRLHPWRGCVQLPCSATSDRPGCG
jgi:hypothetical protein